MASRFDRLCRDLFLLAQLTSDATDSGRRWEQQVAQHLTRVGVPTETLPGGCSFLGRASLSGLNHQIDTVAGCRDAIIIGEWKAHRGTVPKNDLLRFKAVSDDYYLALGPHVPSQPIIRIFGGAGAASTELRRYAAAWGITIIDPARWPAPVLASARTRWPGPRDPHPIDRRWLAWLSRPLQRTLPRQPDGGYRLPPMPSRPYIDAALTLHDHWSDQLWEQIDAAPGRFERLIVHACQDGAA